jgi:hypothetical protein
MGFLSGGFRMGGCKRCSQCSIHYPPHSKHDVCEVCEGPTSYFSNVQPDPEWEEQVKYAKSQPLARATRDPHEHRFEQYLRMGYNEHQAQALANATWGSPPFPLYWGKVKKALDAGCDPVLAFDVFA